MTKNTKTLLTIAGVGVVGYIIYNQFIKKGSKNFANFTRSRRTTLSGCTGGDCNRPQDCPCGECCQNNKCYVKQIDGDGKATFAQFGCTGTRDNQINYPLRGY